MGLSLRMEMLNWLRVYCSDSLPEAYAWTGVEMASKRKH